MINSKRWKDLNKLQAFMNNPALKPPKLKTFSKS